MGAVSRRSFVAGAASVIGAGALVACGDGSSGSAGGSSIVVASVNNGPFMRLKEYVPEFTEKTGISVEFVMLTENDIRSKIQQDASVGGGQFDVVTLGSTDAGPYLDNGWTQPLQPLLDSMDEDAAAEYDAEDLIAANIAAYSSQEKGLAAMPFYGESTMLMYRTDLFEEAGLKMPEEPTWEDVQEFAAALHGPGAGTVGMAIRGKAGYGENMYLFNTIMNAYGGQIADMNWTPGYESPEMAEALEFYKRLQRETGAAEATSNGFTETLNLMSSGGAAIYYDATVAADVFESDDSAIKGKVGYAMSPSGPGKGATQAVGGWGIAVTAGSKAPEAAFDFITWATSKEYVALVAEKEGWLAVPSGSRTSTYATPEYKSVAVYADLVLKSLENVEFEEPAVEDAPYVGNSLPNIPEWSGLGERLGQLLAEYVSADGDTAALQSAAQRAAQQAFDDGGR